MSIPQLVEHARDRVEETGPVLRGHFEHGVRVRRRVLDVHRGFDRSRRGGVSAAHLNDPLVERERTIEDLRDRLEDASPATFVDLVAERVADVPDLDRDPVVAGVGDAARTLAWCAASAPASDCNNPGRSSLTIVSRSMPSSWSRRMPTPCERASLTSVM